LTIFGQKAKCPSTRCSTRVVIFIGHKYPRILPAATYSTNFQRVQLADILQCNPIKVITGCPITNGSTAQPTYHIYGKLWSFFPMGHAGCSAMQRWFFRFHIFREITPWKLVVVMWKIKKIAIPAGSKCQPPPATADLKKLHFEPGGWVGNRVSIIRIFIIRIIFDRIFE
jgi:hypothetical protein